MAGVRAGDAACAGWQVTLCVILYGMQAPVAVHKLPAQTAIHCLYLCYL